MEGHESRRLVGKLGNHARSNAIAYIALFFAVGGGTAFAANTVFSSDIVNGEVTSPDIGGGEVATSDLANDSVTGAKIPNDTLGNVDIKAGGVRASEIANGNVGTLELAADAVTSTAIATDAVGASEIGADTIGSSEIAPGIVGADELDTVHEHTGPATSISTDPTAHDGSYTLSTASVSCGTGEDLLSTSVDWTATGGHNERMTVGTSSITRGEPDAATIEVAYDGGATTATWVPVATCIF